MRVAAPILTLALLAACGDGGLAPLPTDQVRARFPTGGVVDVIEVDAVNRLPLRSAELIANDGRTTPASSLNANPAPAVTFTQQLGSSSYIGNNFGAANIASGAPLPAGLGGATQSRAELLAIVSSASIPLPDPVEYRRDWRRYRIQLRFGDPPDEIDTREIPAPEPPPGS